MNEERKSTGAGAAPAPGGSTGGGLVTSGGKTHIADGVVAKIASRAASDVGGVHSMGDGGAFGNVRERLPGAAGANRGVSVQVGERQAAVDLDLVVDYGVSIPELANAVRDNVIGEVQHMCGLEVVEVNIDVEDIYVQGENERESDSDQPRVR
ncbi:Asp23/Gls24 family envelope stress response protein [Actinomadura graeca]|uniref:Asp23/Gls24 family envelope stress response protein n=1 Tax=Actinomadura graeca TaxID=2750812 RepID=A0ABX8QSD5_9ACTN|nr:Asp23/Gls24 family envelope stress response protein [Actinomadura graeca]QXJ21695.1 Asp23/Gls24 family envelope stress response protein [Actinomadura graeca]